MPANYILLERIELNASAASVTFANIPQTGYTDLKVVATARATTGGVGGVRVNFNGVATNLSERQLEGNGASASSSSTSIGYAIVANGSTDTANTFSNCEIYIPNYTSSNNKSWSADYVSENNATTAYAGLTAGLWSQTAAITSVTLVMTNPFAANSTFSLYGLAALGTTPVIAPKATGGNRIDYDGTYWIHTFTSSGTFTPSTGLSCDYLVVAGGGGGSGASGGSDAGNGGGGAGGFRTSTGLSTLVQAYTITVGAGGAGGVGPVDGSSGSNSVFSSITSLGGSGGNDYGGAATATGGSGGGAGAGAANRSLGTVGQGNDGGISSPNSGAGGGGAGAVGGTASGSTGGIGGTGTSSSYSGSAVTYAGGGGGGGKTTGGSATGGGGAGGSGNQNGVAGTVNLGGGGGGAGGILPSGTNTGGLGGSGIVIIRYLA